MKGVSCQLSGGGWAGASNQYQVWLAAEWRGELKTRNTATEGHGRNEDSALPKTQQRPPTLYPKGNGINPRNASQFIQFISSVFFINSF